MQLVTNSNLQNVNYNSNENECNMQSDNREDVVELDGWTKKTEWDFYLLISTSSCKANAFAFKE